MLEQEGVQGRQSGKRATLTLRPLLHYRSRNHTPAPTSHLFNPWSIRTTLQGTAAAPTSDEAIAGVQQELKGRGHLVRLAHALQRVHGLRHLERRPLSQGVGKKE